MQLTERERGRAPAQLECVCVCVCVTAGYINLPGWRATPPPSQTDAGASGRGTRSDGPGAPARAPAVDTDSRADLSELLARLMSRKGSVRRNSAANSKAGAPSTNHRIIDRDYLGWMDFGRRSAEEYEYSS
uniref:Gastrin/cholecystokinin peptide hormone domain-containing protein n=1 Tax=Electrophorus electricus TaxID=8005 RepID=A0A4W4FLP4_ELEEL